MSPDGGRWLVATPEYEGLTTYTGGIGTHYAGLLPALVAAGADVDLLVLAGEPLTSTSAPGGVALLGTAPIRGRGVLAVAQRARAVARASRARSYDRVFLPEWGALGASLARRTPLLTNLATSTALQNQVSGYSPASFGWRRGAVQVVQSHLEVRQIRRSAGVIAISRAMAARSGQMLGRLPPSRVVPNTVDLARIRSLAQAGSVPGWWPRTGPTILFVGRLERRKGVLEAAAAFGRLCRTHPDAHLVLAGSSGDARFEPDKRDLLDLVPADARGRVHLVGHVPAEQLHAWVRAAAVVTCPSLWEGFGNAALEAKALGAAVVVTRGSGFDDFCADEEDCLMVAPGDADGLARAVARLLDDATLRDRLGQAAARSADAYAPERVAPLLLTAADELLGPVRRERTGATSSRPS
ncbi:glycosyltransferase family 4 protein [Cellulomonas sp. PhB150]|uniref:glycosyltransferase family 4 protein n=1 Tax=Cellulomonas sp. PhB150 TaxID=2485188 RepID=UPI0013154862|nr:glycosyltransferase family 4 protein [Cellulomonas sp. PhB150]